MQWSRKQKVSAVTDGLRESTGIDLPSVLAGIAGAKLLDKSSDKE